VVGGWLCVLFVTKYIIRAREVSSLMSNTRALFFLFTNTSMFLFVVGSYFERRNLFLKLCNNVRNIERLYYDKVITHIHTQRQRG
jgi:hypothetical protein